MYQTEFLPLLKLHLKSCKFLQCVPFEFPQNSSRLVKCQSLSKIRMFKLQCILSVLYCTLFGLNLCFGPLTKIEKFQGFGFFMCYLLASITRWNYELDNGPSQLINAFLDCEETIMTSK